MSTLDFGLRDDEKTQRPPKLTALVFTKILGLFATFVGILSILGILISFYAMFFQVGHDNLLQGLMVDGAVTLLVVSISSLSAAAVVGTLVEISENLKVAAKALAENAR